MFKHILVPTDGSELSRQAVTQAIELARALGARITFFTAVQPLPRIYGDPGAVYGVTAFSEFGDDVRDDASQYLVEAHRLAQESGVASDKLQMDHGEPHAAILEAAAEQKCDLIYMASHGRKGLNALLIGSETNKVLTHGTIPVLVCR